MNRLSSWLVGHARFRPDAEALLDLGTSARWTYASLYDDSLRWAGYLSRKGVVAGDVVAVLARNRGETLALLFAVAELEAILFPMNWRLSTAELGWQVDHARPTLLFADDASRDLLDRPSVALDDGPGPNRFEGAGSALEAPWQLMYTSGSTGRPKAAMLTHQQLTFNAISTTLACDLTPSDATLTFTPLFHTGGLNCLTTPLLHRGGRVVLQPTLEVADALHQIGRERISLLMGVPTIYQMLADAPAFEAADLSSVRDALCGGAPLPPSLLERYLARGIPLRQGFGMTEVGPNCFSTPPARVREKLGSVGLPIHGLEAQIVSPDGALADVDTPGELWLRGPAVFGGYREDPNATAAAIDAEGWFHTGDVLSVDVDGFFSVRGRLKEMFKSGGENVYPAEIEAAIQRHADVAHAAVIGVPDARWGEVGHAFVEPKPGANLTAEPLLEFLRSQLARFKLPRHIELRAALPRTASGKIDKVALRSE